MLRIEYGAGAKLLIFLTREVNNVNFVCSSVTPSE